jgi:Phage P22-like portal protein
MAKNKTYYPKDPTRPKATNPSKKTDEWTCKMFDRASDALTFDTIQRRQCVEDMKFAFVSGHQWDTHLTAKRRNKPNYEFNRVRQLIRRVTGQQLKNKPEIKCRASNDSDVDTAEVLNGMIKNIEVQSSADNAYDTAFQWACGGGYGILRVKSEYESPDTFDQCLRIEAVLDPMTCFCDPSAQKFDRSDARYWFISELIPTSQFKSQWPKADVVDFDVSTETDEWERLWITEDMVRIAEYWYTEKEPKTIHLLSDGSIVDAAEFDPLEEEFANPPLGPPGPNGEPGQPEFAPVTIKSTREVEVDCVYSCPVSGCGKLEEPTKWGGSMIPIVVQWGDLVVIDGKQIFSGMTRFARDSQTIHNFEMSSMVEVVAKLPNSPMKATPAMIKGLESYYERLGYDDPPVLLYNHDPQAPGGSPSREPMAQLPSALASLSSLTVDEMKATTGVYDASVGSSGNETSGRAIMARNAQAETANFVYVDNQVKALKRLGDILVDAMPAYYDAERSIRILGPDLSEKYVTINKMVTMPDGTQKIENDLSRGKYDVTVTIGKSYDTARMELAEFAQTLAGTPGPVGAIGQYLMLKSMDVPGIDDAVEWVRSVLVKQGIIPPGPNDPPPPGPPPPSPVEMAQVQHHTGQAALAQARAADIQAKTQTQVQLEEAKTASLVAKIPGTEAEGHAQMIQNGAALMPQQPVGFVVPHEGPIGPATNDSYTGGY